MKRCLIVVLSLAWCFVPRHLFAQQATLTDNATFPASPGAGDLAVQGDSAPGGPAVTLVKFDLRPDLPAGTFWEHIAKATLTLYVNSLNTPSSIAVHAVTSNWSQGDSEPPTIDTTSSLGPTIQVQRENAYITFDLTEMVRYWIGTDGEGAGGGPNYGIALVAADPMTALLIDSKESASTSHPPLLTILLNRVATATTAIASQSLTPTATVPGSQVSGDINGSASSITGVINGNQVIGQLDAAQLNGIITNATLPGLLMTSAGGSKGDYNTGIGIDSLASNTIGFGNTATGTGALQSNTTGAANTGIGRYSLFSNVSGSQNTALGYQALFFNTGSSNTGTGLQALYSNTSGNALTAYGVGALYSNTTGNDNSAFGVAALFSNTTGIYNTATGYRALYSNSTGSLNSASSYMSLYSNTSGEYNAGTGALSLYSNSTGSYNTGSGTLSLFYNTSGGFNSALGALSLFSNTTGVYNSALGSYSLASNTLGSYNTANGMLSLYSNTSGWNNTSVGFQSLFDLNITAQDAGFNTALGANTARGIVTGVNNTILGANVSVSEPDLSNTIIIADGSGNQRVYVDHAGNVGIATTNPQSALHVEGYIQLALTTGAPPGEDCDAEAEYGRMKIDAVGSRVYFCTSSGWKYTSLLP
jgi:hypothetical protein